MKNEELKDFEDLKQRIFDLEGEVLRREKDIVSLKNTLLEANEKFEKMIFQLQKNINLSFQIQKKLAPTEFSLIPDFEFSMKFIPGPLQGGDYYDIFEQKDRLCFGLIMAESNGYHVSALLLSRLLQMSETFRSKENSRPGEVVKKLIKELIQDIKNDEKTHFFYGQVDRRNFEMRYILMGNILSVFQEYESGRITVLEPCGSSIRRDLKVGDLEEKHIFFNAKDRLILCTQGLLNSKNNKGQSFGIDRLKRSISKAPKKGVHELRNKILFDMNQFSSRSALSKDITILVCEVKDRIIKLA